MALKKIFNHKKKKNLMNLFLNRQIDSLSRHRFAEKNEDTVVGSCIMPDRKHGLLWQA